MARIGAPCGVDYKFKKGQKFHYKLKHQQGYDEYDVTLVKVNGDLKQNGSLVFKTSTGDIKNVFKNTFPTTRGGLGLYLERREKPKVQPSAGPRMK